MTRAYHGTATAATVLLRRFGEPEWFRFRRITGGRGFLVASPAGRIARTQRTASRADGTVLTTRNDVDAGRFLRSRTEELA